MTRNGVNRRPAALKVPPSGRVFGYVRCSTPTQTVLLQRRMIEQWAVARGCTITGSYIDEGVSATAIPFRQRPAGASLWADLCPGDVVVAAWTDRMFRSEADCYVVIEALRLRGVRLALLDINKGADDILDDAQTRRMVMDKASTAEQQVERHGAGIRITKEGQRARGEYCGGLPPFGYRRDGDKLVPVPEQQAAIEEILRLRAAGCSLRQVAAAITASGISISHVGVGNVLAAAVTRQAAA